MMTHNMHGKTCLITGATRGLGLETAIQLARMGASVVIAGRSPERLHSSAEKIRAAAPGQAVTTLTGDLSAQAEVRRIANEFAASHPTLDVLVNNVGANNMSFACSPDGIEQTWALNFLNHFLLTNLLLPNLRRAAEQSGEARIIEVSSGIYTLASSRFDRQQEEKGYNGVIAYAQTKRAMLVFVTELTRRLAGTGITANAVTPGLVATNIASQNAALYRVIMRVLSRFALRVDDGVRPIVHLCAAPQLRGVSGAFYKRHNRRRLPASITAPETGRGLWDRSAKAVGLSDNSQHS